MILSEFVPPLPHPIWALCRQLGVTQVIVKANPTLTGMAPPYQIDTLRSIQQSLAGEGLTLYGLEGDQFDMARIKLGLAGRDEDLEHYSRMLANMGELGIKLLCYNFMAQIGWCRSRDEPTRGGALATRFRLSDMPALTPVGEVPAEKIWENYTYFLKAVMPAAEKAGVRMALHPDDPPLPALSGVGRIFHTPEAFERALALVPSPASGITFCQANFKLMGVELEPWIRRFAAQEKLFFVHIRDVRGTADDFVETFHDDGPTDMTRMFRLYHEAGFAGPVRCDHVPTMAGEGEGEGFVPGYGTLGRLFAIGYFKGIMDALGIPRQ